MICENKEKAHLRAYEFITRMSLSKLICFTPNLCLFFSILFNNINMSLRTKVEMHQWAFTVFPPLTAYLVSLQILLTESRNCAPPHGSSPLSLTWIIAVALDLFFLTLVFSHYSLYPSSTVIGLHHSSL